MKIIPLDNDGLSLEFDPIEWPAIKERLERRGSVSRSRMAGYSKLELGGVSLLFMDEEWDGYALIASDAAGVQLLNEIGRAPLAHQAAPVSRGRSTRGGKRDRLTA